MPLSQIISQVLMNPDEEDVPAETQLSVWVDNLSSPSYGYNVQRTRAVIEGFWQHVQALPPWFPATRIDPHFLRVYYFLADQTQAQRPRPDLLRFFAEDYSRMSRQRVVDHARDASQFFTWLRNFAWHRLLALGVVGMEVDLSQHEEFVENYIQQHQLMAERAAESMQALADAEADLAVVLEHGVYWSPATHTPPRPE
ncbi:hypothetical protein LXA43DRAFT_1058596 [Ganoderma leucocontextum]|nr:hypothetical protein LXA43DRAFT_1067282 [Ganoderma leucocontextum]KAI1783866.1 hypothetical protein LXA43DRAFT_1102040 [Ganoderma leucocontextum]KAI1793812.1 hypothetical protein LXA43DRAFT_1059465 [Ganoderma leucocontextum]KAI1795471.1 hypothetical protein LXA43DRAFT_1058596 [Ganoderma leucocontextum]